MSNGSGEFITSEFSVYEVLYQHSDSLTWAVEHILANDLSDPFELVARIEAANGKPLAFS